MVSRCSYNEALVLWCVLLKAFVSIIELLRRLPPRLPRDWAHARSVLVYYLDGSRYRMRLYNASRHTPSLKRAAFEVKLVVVSEDYDSRLIGWEYGYGVDRNQLHGPDHYVIEHTLDPLVEIVMIAAGTDELEFLGTIITLREATPRVVLLFSLHAIVIGIVVVHEGAYLVLCEGLGWFWEFVDATMENTVVSTIVEGAIVGRSHSKIVRWKLR